MPLNLMKTAQYKVMPWKNGLGSTAQIDIVPDGASFPGEDFLWRLSSATVSQGSAFSQFPGCDRLLVVWKGEGLLLNGVPLLPLKILKFSGEDVIDCQLIGGPVVDVGMIFRRDRVEAELAVHSLKASKQLNLKSNFKTAYVFCASGSVATQGVEARAGNTLCLSAENYLSLQAVEDSLMFIFTVRMKK